MGEIPPPPPAPAASAPPPPPPPPVFIAPGITGSAAPTPPIIGQAAPYAAPAYGPDGAPPAPPYVQDVESPKRSRGRLAVLGVAAAAVLGFGTLGVNQLVSDTDSGSGSSQGVVEDLAIAISNEDIIGTIELMSPNEIGQAADLYPLIIELAQEQDQLGGDDPLAGIDLEISGLELDVQELHSDVHKVYLDGGSAQITVTPEDLDTLLWGDLVEEMPGGGVVEESQTWSIGELQDDLEREARFEGYEVSGLFLMTVREDGNWYISPEYTALEYAREALDLPEADFTLSRDLETQGSASPEAVVTDFADALEAIDELYIEELLNNLDAGVIDDPFEIDQFSEGIRGIAPGEYGAFVDYAPMFTALYGEVLAGEDLDQLRRDFDEQLDEAREAFAEAGLELNVDVEVEARTEDLGNNRVKVTVASGSLTIAGSALDDGRLIEGDVTLEVIDGTCGRVQGNFDGDTVDEFECAQNLLPGAGFDGFYIVVTEHDGEWYFSPIETILEYVRDGIESELAN